MTTITFGRLPGGLFAGSKTAFAQWLNDVIEHRRHERAVRVAVQQLESLEDRVLNDMGIQRWQIEDVVRHGR